MNEHHATHLISYLLLNRRLTVGLFIVGWLNEERDPLPSDVSEPHHQANLAPSGYSSLIDSLSVGAGWEVSAPGLLSVLADSLEEAQILAEANDAMNRGIKLRDAASGWISPSQESTVITHFKI